MIASVPPYMGLSMRRWADAQGRFEWDSAPEGPVAFHIWSEGYIGEDPVRLTAGDQEAVVVLKPAVSVRLEIVDAGSGKPLPMFRVEVGTPEPGTKEFRWGPPLVVETRSIYRKSLDADSGPYQFRITAEGYEPAQILVGRGAPMNLREVIRLQKASR